MATGNGDSVDKRGHDIITRSKTGPNTGRDVDEEGGTPHQETLDGFGDVLGEAAIDLDVMERNGSNDVTNWSRGVYSHTGDKELGPGIKWGGRELRQFQPPHRDNMGHQEDSNGRYEPDPQKLPRPSWPARGRLTMGASAHHKDPSP